MRRRFIYLTAVFILGGCTNHPHQEKVDDPTTQILNNFKDYKIEIVTPGSKSSDGTLQSLNKVITPNITFDLQDRTYEEKAMQFKNAFLDPENDIIWALRGGAGTGNIIDILLDDQEFMSQAKESRKVVVGYCDVTSLHLFLSQTLDMKTVHAAVFQELVNNSKDRRVNFDLIYKLVNGTKKFTLVGLEALNKIATEGHPISGKVTGGNISIIQTSIGTRWQIQTKNKILFLEDCHEKPYRILRMLEHFQAAGVFNNVKAVIIGNLCDDSATMQEFIKGFAEKLRVSVYRTDMVGHGKYNYPIVYNAQGSISSENGSIKFSQDLN